MYLKSYRLLEFEKPGLWTGSVELVAPKKKFNFENENREIVERAMAIWLKENSIALPEQLYGLS